MTRTPRLAAALASQFLLAALLAACGSGQPAEVPGQPAEEAAGTSAGDTPPVQPDKAEAGGAGHHQPEAKPLHGNESAVNDPAAEAEAGMTAPGEGHAEERDAGSSAGESKDGAAGADEPDGSGSGSVANGRDEAGRGAGAGAKAVDDGQAAQPQAKRAEAMPSKPTPAEPKPRPAEPKPADEPKPAPAEKAAVHVVEIKDFAFSPAELEIRVGDTVRFINRDEAGHTATADDGSFDTGLLKQDKSGEVAFASAGTFGYYCAPHPGMKGTVVVRK